LTPSGRHDETGGRLANFALRARILESAGVAVAVSLDDFVQGVGELGGSLLVPQA
jgi:hypothetical protein